MGRQGRARLGRGPLPVEAQQSWAVCSCQHSLRGRVGGCRVCGCGGIAPSGGSPRLSAGTVAPGSVPPTLVGPVSDLGRQKPKAEAAGGPSTRTRAIPLYLTAARDTLHPWPPPASPDKEGGEAYGPSWQEKT